MHVNAYKTDQATGCEVEYASDSGKAYADKVSADIAGSLGLTNRGAKLQGDLYVLKHTSMTAILIEPFFCDNKDDCSKYNAEKLATVIVKGITGVDTSVQTQVTAATTPIVQAAPTYDLAVPIGPNIWQIPGTPFYIEQRADGDMSIHLDRVGNFFM